METSSAAMQPLWQAVFGSKKRPEIYSSDTPDENGFLPITDPQEFVSDMTTLNAQQLYTTSSNNQLALRAAQEEYLLIQDLLNELQGKEPAKNPQDVPDRATYEDTKESQLYSYKYEKHKPALLNRAEDDITDREKADVRLPQEPFQQGGFVPSERQSKSIIAKAKDQKNPDGWKPVERDGRRFVPRQQVYHEEYVRHGRQRNTADGETDRPGTAGSFSSTVTPMKVENKQLGRTRFGGQKVPPTRDVSEAPSVASTPRGRKTNTPKRNIQPPPLVTPDGSPAPKRRKPNNFNQYLHPLQNQFQPGHPVINSNAGEQSRLAPVTFTHVNGTIPATLHPPLSTSNGHSAIELRTRKWKDEDLLKAVKYDHSWLSDDKAKAAHMKDKIINSSNPIRTFAMYMKWMFWKGSNMDKRPRNRKTGEEGGDRKGRRSANGVSSATDNNRHSNYATIAVGEDKAQVDGRVNGAPETLERSTGLGIDGIAVEAVHDDDATEAENEAEASASYTDIRLVREEPHPSIEQATPPKEQEEAKVNIFGSQGSTPVTVVNTPSPARLRLRGPRVTTPGSRRSLRSTAKVSG